MSIVSLTTVLADTHGKLKGSNCSCISNTDWVNDQPCDGAAAAAYMREARCHAGRWPEHRAVSHKSPREVLEIAYQGRRGISRTWQGFEVPLQPAVEYHESSK